MTTHVAAPRPRTIRTAVAAALRRFADDGAANARRRYSVATAAAEIEATSFAWTLDNSTSLGDFLFDPRDPGCAKRQNVQGGLLGASVEKHSPTELTITVQQDPTPVRIRFLNEQDATTFESRVAENAVLCQQKFQASLETAVAAHQQGR